MAAIEELFLTSITHFWLYLCLDVSIATANVQISNNPHQQNVISGSCSPSYYTNPKCKDHPGGYGCECGPGFHWNTEKCMSSAIDSRFEFRSGEPITYALLLGKGFPPLTAFTITFWINVNDPTHKGTILSYKDGNQTNLLRMMSGPTLTFEINGHHRVTDIELVKEKWYHIALSWDSKTGVWCLYMGGQPAPGGIINSPEGLPPGGEFVLGQSSRPDFIFDSTLALDGDLSHVNIWNVVMSGDQIKNITNGCTFMYCGNAVQWVEFRSGTRGALKMRWPSGIYTGQCVEMLVSARSCDSFCSHLIGAQCNEETKENIKWSRQRANHTTTVPCPALATHGANVTDACVATRYCDLDVTGYDGIWGEPNIDGCISGPLLQIKKKFLEFESGTINEVEVLKVADRLLNHSKENIYLNPIDLATVIDLLGKLVNTQSIAPRTFTWKDGDNTFAEAIQVYPTLQQTTTFCELLINTVDNLLAPHNEAGWNATIPSGAEGDQLLKVMHKFADVISTSLNYHIRDNLIDYREAKMKIIRKYIEFKIETQWVHDVQSLEFPDSRTLGSDGRPAREAGFVRLTKEAILATNATSSLTVFMGISTFRYKTLARMLPTQDLALKSKEDHVNTPIMAVYFHMQFNTDSTNNEIGNLTSPIFVHLPIIDTHNISNPNCVRLRHSSGRREWKWHRNICSMIHYNKYSAVCACSRPGVYAITTDMYDNNWDKGAKRPKLMNFASYFGCTVSITLCLMVLAIHIYLKTSTSTAALHRNLSVSIALSHIVFMFGIDRYDKPVLCHVFAILLHYFFLSTYSWIMNEAFNLYIVITYSTHNPSDLKDSGSMLRYYILGWVLPAIMVGAFVGTSDDYYAKDVCWVSSDHIWLFVGPAIGIISITILVLIFTAKEHNENSYTKSDKTNKIINIHMKALWTQVILITACWAFAFISIKMVDTILKYLYAMFTFLQGAFFLVFYMFLHEEVRSWIKSHQKKRALHLQGIEYQDNHSLDSFTSNGVLDRDVIDGYSVGTSTRGRDNGGCSLSLTGCSSCANVGGSLFDRSRCKLCKQTRPARLRVFAQPGNNEANSQEGSDCDIISSV